MKSYLHAITNPVSMERVADLILALGETVVMARYGEDAREVTKQSQGLLLNLGVPDDALYETAKACGRIANDRGIPLVLDPLGVALSAYRQRQTLALLSEVKPTVLRGNGAEILTLAGRQVPTRGIDSPKLADLAGPEEVIEAGRSLARDLDCLVVLTGAQDYLFSGDRHWLVSGGSPRLSRLTGMGDALDALILVRLCQAGTSPETVRLALSQMKQVSQAAAGIRSNLGFWEVCLEGLGNDVDTK